YHYDFSGRVKAAENAEARVDYQYDPVRRVYKEKVSIKSAVPVRLPATTVYSKHDARGRRILRGSDYGRSLEYGYDANGWLTRLTFDDAGEIRIQRDPRGRAVLAELPGGVNLSRKYDSLG